MRLYEVMCFGDSNTWGTVARRRISDPHLRYDRSIRWPCVAQKELGEGYALAEEGLGGRTTVYTADERFPFKNGLYMLEGCLKTNAPLDLVTLMLGTNDLHLPWKLPEEELGEGIIQLIRLIQAHPEYGWEKAPDILLIAPPYITPSAPDARTEVYGQFFGAYGERLSHLFPALYARIAGEYGCYFLDAQQYTQPDPRDGVHLTPESHLRLAHAVAQKIREIHDLTKRG